jgi:hypothetical protein
MGKNSELKVLISEIERRIDLSAEMPQELFLFLSRITPLVNVDLLIQDDERGPFSPGAPTGTSVPAGTSRAASYGTRSLPLTAFAQ